MSRVYYYELIRLVKNKIFWGMLLILGVFSWFVLSREIIMGIGYTAPFSDWSYGAYLSKTLPFALMSALLLLSEYYGGKQKKTGMLTNVTPMPAGLLMLIRVGAVGTFFLLDCVVLTAAAFVFYGVYFHVSAFGSYLLLDAVMAVPCFVFFAGLGLWLGRIHKGLLYLLCIVVLGLGISGIFGVANPFCADYFAALPMTRSPGADGEVLFVWTAGFIMMRIAYFAVGAVLLALGSRGD